MDAATVLEEAADLLLVKGRCVQKAVDGEGRYCVLGAITTALGLDADADWDDQRVLTHPAIEALAEHLRKQHPQLGAGRRLSNGCAIYAWNDGYAPEIESLPTDDDVIDTLRRVAKDIRNEARSS